MEFKQWLYEAKAMWKLSPDKTNKSPGLFNQAASSFIDASRNIKNELMWGKEPGGGPKKPSSYLPSIADIKKGFQDPNQEQNPKDMPMPWQQAKQQGYAIASPVQNLSNVGNNAGPAMEQAFETFIQSLPRQDVRYTAQVLQFLRTKGYLHFLNPPRPQTNPTTGIVTFEFVVPKPEFIN